MELTTAKIAQNFVDQLEKAKNERSRLLSVIPKFKDPNIGVMYTISGGAEYNYDLEMSDKIYQFMLSLIMDQISEIESEIAKL